MEPAARPPAEVQCKLLTSRSVRIQLTGINVLIISDLQNRFQSGMCVCMCGSSSAQSILLISLAPCCWERLDTWASARLASAERAPRTLWGERSEASILPAAFKVVAEKQPKSEFGSSEFQNKEREGGKERKTTSHCKAEHTTDG